MLACLDTCDKDGYEFFIFFQSPVEIGHILEKTGSRDHQQPDSCLPKLFQAKPHLMNKVS